MITWWGGVFCSLSTESTDMIFFSTVLLYFLLSVLAFRYWFSTRGRKFKTVMFLSWEILISHMKNILYDIIEEDDLRYVSIIAVSNLVICYRV
jgi:hypothetical protein